MHELSLLKNLLHKIQNIAEDNNSNKVIGVKVKLGALAHISADHFRGHFEQAVKGTIVQGAKLEVESLTDMSDPHAQEIILDAIEVA